MVWRPVLKPRGKAPAKVDVVTAEDLGGLLRARRRELGYTQQQVSQLSGMSQRLVSEIERGRGTVGIQKVLDYAHGLGIDVKAETRGQG